MEKLGREADGKLDLLDGVKGEKDIQGKVESWD